MARPSLLLLLALLPAAPALSAEAPRPNILVILADDLGFSDLGCYGGEIETPNLDRLARSGLRFTQFTNTARCWPSRAALLTGYYAQQVNRDPMGARPPWAALLPQLLEPAGYRSYHSGKWHVDGPVLAGGFARSYWLEDYNRNFNPQDHRLDDQPLPPVQLADGYYTTTAIASRAIEWLGKHESKSPDRPFFLYLAFTVPHFPLQAPAEDVAKYRGRFAQGWDALRDDRLARMKAEHLLDCELSPRTPGVAAWDSLSADEKESWQRRMEVHAAMVDRMDQEIGRVVDEVARSGKLDDTLIVFLSDNGASAEKVLRGDGHDPSAPPGSARTFLCLEPGWANLANAPLRKSKIFTHEGGISTPAIVHWPKGIAAKGELRHAPAHLVDLVPTLLELAGAPSPTAWSGQPRPALPGISLVPALASDVTAERPPIFYKHEGNRALRSGDWKIVSSGKNSTWELYDLSKDRSETRDLAPSRPDKVSELERLWESLDGQYARDGATATPAK